MFQRNRSKVSKFTITFYSLSHEQYNHDLCFSVAGPQPDWDPDIVAALDDDFDFDNPENQLDDDFVVEANAPGTHDNKYRCGFRLSLVGLSGSARDS